MRSKIRASLVSTLALLAAGSVLAPAALATPPDHAPAHGYRAKQKGTTPKAHEPEDKKGIEIVYDSERGVYVGVHLPDVFFYEGRYYRESDDGSWQVSASGDGGWSVTASSTVPSPIAKAGRHHPGPAKKAGKGK